ncbi:MAG: Plug and carboxypeptidase regulatory-like domain-containing protein, partial [Acidobacteriota bacterium]|nr:Plug and carboxypeptidase regulatory-like domain-containing protein [Acidobacteriota bacterium]
MAQTCAPGELRVFVVDSQAGPIFDASVRIAAGQETLREASTLSLGAVDFPSLPCGALTVTATKDGFELSTRPVTVTNASHGEITLRMTPQAQRSSVDVTATAGAIEQTSSQSSEVRPSEVKVLPTNPASVAEVLPLVPGIVRSAEGELSINGSGEHRSALVVNQTDVTDPATGKFGQTIPIDSIESVNVLNTPFLAQYGRFTSSVVAVETRRGGEMWHADLNDPFPDFCIRSWHMCGIKDVSPRGVLGGPLLPNRLYLNTALQYNFQRESILTLPYPRNGSKKEWFNSFTQFDLVLSPKQIVTATFHISPQHTNFVNPDYFNPQPVTPAFAQHTYAGTLADHWGLFGGILDSSVSVQRFNVVIGSQGGADMVLSPLGNRGNYFGVQNRDARRTEWLETWSPVPLRGWGTHLLKTGTSLTGSSDDGQFTYRPVNIVNAAGVLLERIDFSNRNPFSRVDQEVTFFLQDHWSIGPR